MSPSRRKIPVTLATLATLAVACGDGGVAGPRDAAANAPADAAIDVFVPPDLVGTIPPGQECPSATGCAPSVDCWWASSLNMLLCTNRCCTDADCQGIGFEACCMVPMGPQPVRLCVSPSLGVCAAPKDLTDGSSGGDGGDGGTGCRLTLDDDLPDAAVTRRRPRHDAARSREI
ncbi:MAG: hypothetical protein AABZ30_12375 [Myxococcota bacterium]